MTPSGILPNHKVVSTRCAYRLFGDLSTSSRVDVLPQFRRDPAGEVANIGRGDDGRHTQHQRLRRQDHVGVNGVVGRGGLALLPRQRLEFGGLAHGRRCQGHVIRRLRQSVESSNARRAGSPKKLTPQFVIGYFRDDKCAPLRQSNPQAIGSTPGCQVSGAAGEKPKRCRIQ